MLIDKRYITVNYVLFFTQGENGKLALKLKTQC